MQFGIDGNDLLIFYHYPDINALQGNLILKLLISLMPPNLYVIKFFIEPGGRSFKMTIVLGSTDDLDGGFFYEFKYFYNRHDGNYLQVGKQKYWGLGRELLDLGRKTDNVIYKLINSMSREINIGAKIIMRGMTGHEIPEAEEAVNRFLSGKSRSRSRSRSRSGSR